MQGEEPKKVTDGWIERLLDGRFDARDEDAAASSAHPLERVFAGFAVVQKRFNEPAEATQYAGEIVGTWQLQRMLGQGGMGQVWLARRIDARIDQQVAIKFVRSQKPSLRKRLMQEQSLLARLDHPHIARFLDAGELSEQGPYLVMEYVDGVPIDLYCQSKQLALREVLALFLQVCDAVQSAHRQFIVHRDIKPSNVFVTTSGMCKLLDFGIARILEHELSDPTTNPVLTLAYSAPELLRGELITTATDVFALGLLLHELIVGKLPAGREQAPVAELARSDRDWLLDESASKGKNIDADLVAILQQSIRGNPADRYASVTELMSDVRAYLSGKEITARTHTVWYRTKCFVRRHRLAVAAASIAMLGLLVGSAVALWQAQVAKLSASQAHAQAQRAETVKQVLLSMFSELDPVLRAQRAAMTPTQLVSQSIAEVQKMQFDDADARWDLLADLGDVQSNLGDTEAARALLKAAHTQIETAPVTELTQLKLQLSLAKALFDSDPKQARELSREAVQSASRLKLQDSIWMARAKAMLARSDMMAAKVDANNLQMMQEAWTQTRNLLGDSASETQLRWYEWGVHLEQDNQFPVALEATQALVEVIGKNLGLAHPRLVMPLTQLGNIHRRLGQSEQALVSFERAEKIIESSLGPNHPILGKHLLRYGDTLTRSGQLERAETVLLRASGLVQAGTSEHAQAQMYLGLLRRRQGKLEDAEQSYRLAFEAYLQVIGPHNPITWGARLEQGRTLARLERLGEAEPVLMEAREHMLQIAGERSSDYIAVNDALAGLRRAQGRPMQAVELRDAVLPYAIELFGPDSPNVVALQGSNIEDLVKVATPQALAEARRACDALLMRLERKTEREWQLAYMSTLLLSVRLSALQNDRSRAENEKRQIRAWVNAHPEMSSAFSAQIAEVEKR